MAVLDLKVWLRNNIKPYLTQIKAEINAVASTVNSVTGSYRGAFTTVAAMPTGTPIKNGDWAILTVDDGANESGIYVKATAGWQYVMDIATFQEITQMIATDAEFNAGTSTTKVPTVKQVQDKANAIASVANTASADATNALNAVSNLTNDLATYPANVVAVVDEAVFDTAITVDDANQDPAASSMSGTASSYDPKQLVKGQAVANWFVKVWQVLYSKINDALSRANTIAGEVSALTAMIQSGWVGTANTGQTDGVDNFIGTQDSVPIRIKTNNVERGIVTVDGKFGLSTTTPESDLEFGSTYGVSMRMYNTANPIIDGAYIHILKNGTTGVVDLLSMCRIHSRVIRLVNYSGVDLALNIPFVSDSGGGVTNDLLKDEVIELIYDNANSEFILISVA